RKRIPHLALVPAKTRFLSCEPLLGPIDLTEWRDSVDWVIAGGESGAYARPSDPQWFRSLLMQCRDQRIPFHFKQWGEWAPATPCSPKGRAHRSDYSVELVRLGKKESGRRLYGRTWDDFPTRPAVAFA